MPYKVPMDWQAAHPEEAGRLSKADTTPDKTRQQLMAERSKLNLNRGVVTKHIESIDIEISQYLDTGEYVDALGGPVSNALARAAGFDVPTKHKPTGS